MDSEFGFVLVGNALMEPQFGLRVDAVKPRSDTGSEISLQLWHDPLLRPNELTMPFPAEDRERWLRYSSAPPPEQLPFRSGLEVRIASIEVDTSVNGNRLEAVITSSARALAATIESLQHSAIAAIAAHGPAILRRMLIDAEALPIWDREVSNIISADVQAISLRIDLPSSRLLHFDKAPAELENELLLLWEREVRR